MDSKWARFTYFNAAVFLLAIGILLYYEDSDPKVENFAEQVKPAHPGHGLVPQPVIGPDTANPMACVVYAQDIGSVSFAPAKVESWSRGVTVTFRPIYP